jgi:REP element-mobilizing transposase RayT
MARKPRIELVGYHHIINRAVNRSDVFKDSNDYDIFLGIVCKACRLYGVVLHDYCLMSNHFHLLVETSKENLSSFMKHINGNYAMYANKKYKRSGHFWQGRFYSRYITSEDYYYTLIRYIEQNPIEAKIVDDIKDYPYTLGSVIANKETPIKCTFKSKLLQELTYENIQELIGIKLNDEELKTLEQIKNQKVVQKDKDKKLAYSKSLKEHFVKCKTKDDRNKAILQALDDGYTQIQIANFLNVSRSLVSKIVKEKFE